MAIRIFSFPQSRAFDGNGNPIPQAEARFYFSQTATPRLVYADQALTTPAAALGASIVSDANGVFSQDLWSADLNLKVIIKGTSTTPGSGAFDGTTLPNGTIDPLGPSFLGMAATSTCNGRLTLLSGTAVPATDQTARTILFFTPYKGNQIALYDGAGLWNVTTFAETAITLAGLTADTNYDVFGYSASGVLTLELLAWTNATTRATAIVAQDGVYVKTGATTRRYLGTIRTTGTTGQCDDSGLKRFVWNMQNRVQRPMFQRETAINWTYSTAAYRQANANTANQLAFVRGLDEDALTCQVAHSGYSSGATFRNIFTGIGLDAVNAIGASSAAGFAPVNNTAAAQINSFFYGLAGLGYHIMTWIEQGDGADIQTWGTSSAGGGISAMVIA